MTGRSGQMTIFVRDFAIEAEIGIHHHERGTTQPLVFTVDLEVDTPERDAIADTVDYTVIVTAIRTVLDRGHIETVEYCVRAVAAMLRADPRIRSIRIRAEKPCAIGGAAAAGASWRESGT